MDEKKTVCEKLGHDFVESRLGTTAHNNESTVNGVVYIFCKKCGDLKTLRTEKQ